MERGGCIMYGFSRLDMNSERKTEISLEEIEDNDIYSDESWGEEEYEDEEPQEREYCD